MKEHILSYIQDHEEEIVRLSTELIGANTVNPPGNEYLAVDIIKKYFSTHSIRYETFEKVAGRTNIIGYIGKGSPTLLVACHLDVVPAGDGWDTDPFKSVVKDGRIFGRGANDNKGQMAPMLVLAKLLKENESTLNGSLMLIGAADEEKGSRLGLEYLLDECGITADYAIIPDVANNMKIIDVGEKGALFLNIISHGKQCHGSTPEKGTNAIWNMIELLNQVKELKHKCISHELFTPPTMNLGTISGGAAHNIVPAKCEAKLDIRYLPGETGKEILDNNYKIIASGRKISDIEAITKSVAVNASGERVGTNDLSMADLSKGIALLQAAEKSGTDPGPLLNKLGISVSRDGLSKIYTAKDGSFVIDTRGGVGAVANNLMTASDLRKTGNVVSEYVGKSQLSDNQLASLTLLADHVGVDNFKNSRALQLVKAAEYSKVPNSMLDFNKGTVGYSRRPVTRRDYIERGQMYGELFQTPDSIALPSFEEGTSFGAMAKVIKFTRLG